MSIIKCLYCILVESRGMDLNLFQKHYVFSYVSCKLSEPHMRILSIIHTEFTVIFTGNAIVLLVLILRRRMGKILPGDFDSFLSTVSAHTTRTY